MVIIVAGCLEPYAPPVPDREINFLAVDAFLNAGNKSIDVKLARALPLAANSKEKAPVSNANVFLEDENGAAVRIPETSDGQYTASKLKVSIGNKYQLRIKTP